MPEKDFQRVSTDVVISAVRTYGSQKRLAVDLELSDVELSRLVNGQLPKFCALLDKLGLEITPQNHVRDLRAVLKAVL